MNYYALTTSCDLKIIGDMPQVQRVQVPSSWDSPFALGMRFHQKVDVDTEIPKAVLAKKAKLTDFMISSHLPNRLLSERLKSCINLFEVEGVEFVPTVVLVDGATEINYWFSNPLVSGSELLDYEKSIIGRRRIGGREMLNQESFANHQEFDQALKKQHQYALEVGLVEYPLSIFKPVFRKDLTIDFAVLERLSLDFPVEFVVSERLKKRLEYERFTGFEFRPF